MAIAHVQTLSGGNASGGVTTLSAIFGSTVTSGSAIMVAWRYSSGSGARTVTVSDANGNTYVSNPIQAYETADNSTNGIAYALNVTGGASLEVSFAISGAAATLRMSISEFSGVATSAALDKTASAIGSGTALASGAVTPTTNGQLFFCDGHLDATSTFTAGTDFTLATTVPAAGGTHRLAADYYIQPTAASHDGTITSSASGAWGCALATFKAPGAATGGSPKLHGGLTKGALLRGGRLIGA